jgi:hypothetical protein
MTDLLKLSWQIQLALGAGYAAYMLCYVGIREHHKPIDTTFKAVVFSLIASATLWLTREWTPIEAGATAFAASLAAGLLWRLVGINGFRTILRVRDVSWADDSPSAWHSLTSGNSRYRMSQISVLTDDNLWLTCDDVFEFDKDPFGPVLLGPTGDVALFITGEQPEGGTETPHKAVRFDGFGSRMTYIPASKIRRIAFRYDHPKPSAVSRWLRASWARLRSR